VGQNRQVGGAQPRIPAGRTPLLAGAKAVIAAVFTVMAFPETHWTMLARATLNGDEAGRAALEELCRRYWPAVHDYLTGRGLTHVEAEDVTQDFFSGLMRSGGWHAADRTRGRFRNFILGAVERTLTESRRRSGAGKRGGGTAPVSLEELAGTGIEPAAAPADDRRFDAAWAERVLEVAMDALELGMSEQGRSGEFAALVAFLGGSASQAGMDSAAAALGVSAAAIKSKIFRLRQRYRDVILGEVSRTVGTPHEAEAEMAYLFEVLSQPGFDPGAIAGETGEPEIPN